VTRRPRWPAAAAAGVLLSTVLVMAAAWRAGQRSAGAYALRSAGTIASYLALVTPAARNRSSGYDLGPLLVQARGLATLPGLGVDVEVYHGTAPLVRAGAPSLSPDGFDRLRSREATAWRDGRAVVPLKDRDDWDVVGAVVVRPRRAIMPLLSPWLLGALVLALLAGWGAVLETGREGRRALLTYVVAALTLGAGSYLGVRGVARASTDRWLADARLLVQDVAARAPRGRVPLTALAGIVRGATLSTARPAALTPRRERSERGLEAVLAVRLSAGRWLELRTIPAEVGSAGWLVVLGALALLGPGVAAVAHRAARLRPRELRTTVTAWCFLAPAAIHLAVFALAPMLFAAYLAVHRWNLADPVKPFVGLANFADLAAIPWSGSRCGTRPSSR
jgi:hypothetical protein